MGEYEKGKGGIIGYKMLLESKMVGALGIDCTEKIKAIRTAQDEMFVNLYDGFDELDAELNVNGVIEP